MKAPKKFGKGRGGKWQLPDRHWLNHQYNVLNKSALQISLEIGGGHGSGLVHRWLAELGVEKKPWPRPVPSKEWLKHQYVTLRKPAIDIAVVHDISEDTAYRWLRDAGIQVRSRKGKNNPAWKGGHSRSYARKLLKRSGILQECCWCGQPWTGKYSLHVHHKDHDKANNRLENLCWLCYHCNLLEAHAWNLWKAGRLEIEVRENGLLLIFPHLRDR